MLGETDGVRPSPAWGPGTGRRAVSGGGTVRTRASSSCGGAG